MSGGAEAPTSLPQGRVLCLLLSLGVLLPVLGLYFLYDDWPMLRAWAPSGGAAWWHFAKPISNGFWRPLNGLAFMLVDVAAGQVAWPHHLVSLAAHLALAGAILRRCRGLLQCAAVAAIFCASAAVIPAVAHPSNLADQLLGAACVASLAGWVGWLRGERSPLLALVALAIGFGCKEASVTIPLGWLLVWAALRRECVRPAAQVLRMLGAGGALALAACIAVWLSLRSNAGSYAAAGRLSMEPVFLVRNFLDYASATLFPTLHVMELPRGHSLVTHGLLWCVRGVAGLALGALALSAWQRGGAALGLACAALAPLLAVSLLKDPIQGRFLYATCAIFALAVSEAPTPGRAAARALAVACELHVLLSIWTSYASPTMRAMRYRSDVVETLASEIRARARGWPDDTFVCLSEPPMPSTPPHDWIYTQLVFDVALHPRHVNVRIGNDPACAYRYRLERGALVETQRP